MKYPRFLPSCGPFYLSYFSISCIIEYCGSTTSFYFFFFNDISYIWMVSGVLMGWSGLVGQNQKRIQRAFSLGYSLW